MSLDRDAVQRVLSRASEMTAAHPSPPTHQAAMTEDLLLEAATEAGIDPDAVRVSLAIERLGVTPPGRRRDRIAGRAMITVDRMIELDVNTLLGRLDDLLRDQHQLERTRSRSDRGEWRKRTGAVGAMQRAAKRSGGGAGLSTVAVIQARTAEVEPGRTLIRLIADRRARRSTVVTTSAVATGTAVAAIGTLAVVASPLALVGTPLALVIGGATTRVGRRQAERMADELERLLDAAERGARPQTLSDDMRRVIRSLRR